MKSFKLRGDQSLDSDAFHYWIVPSVHSLTLVENQAQEILSPYEIDRAAKFSIDRKRKTFIAGQVFLRTVLASYLATSPSLVSFVYGEHGKPSLTGIHAGIEFNLSHSGDVLLLGLAASRPVGIDVEEIRPERRWKNLAERFYSVEERTHLLQGDAKDFYQIWTYKEALIKACGLGLSVPLRKFSTVPSLKFHAGFETPIARKWWIKPLLVSPAYAAAVCLGGENEPSKIERFEF